MIASTITWKRVHSRMTEQLRTTAILTALTVAVVYGGQSDTSVMAT